MRSATTHSASSWPWLHGDTRSSSPSPRFDHKPLLERVRVVPDQGVRDAQDALGGAVVLLEFHDLQVRPVGLEGGEVLRARPAPGVDRLVVVADRRERAEPVHQLAHQRVLRRVGVLVLVDQQVADLAAPALADLRVRLEQLHGQPDQVVEVHRVARPQQLVVARVEQRHAALALVGGRAEAPRSASRSRSSSSRSGSAPRAARRATSPRRRSRAAPSSSRTGRGS